MINLKIEIEKQNEKELIEKEIRFVLQDFIEEDFDVVVPSDFNKHVNEKLNSKLFNSNRDELNQFVIGKLIGENHLVFNPLLYTEYFNTQIRSVYYLHEYRHIINKKKLFITTENPVEKKLISLLNFLMDEYSANRFAFDSVKKIFELDNKFLNHFKTISDGHFENFTNSQIYYEVFDRLIHQFQTHQISIGEFVAKIENLIERYSIEIVSFYSIADSLSFDSNKIDGSRLRLIELLRDSYENDKYTFNEEMIIAIKYLEYFGIKMENKIEGIYYKVIERKK